MKKLAFVVVSLLVIAVQPVEADEWRYDAVLYGWLAGLDGTIGFGNVGEQKVDATFEDLAGFVDFAMAGHFQAQSSQFVLFADLSYTGLKSERDAMVANQPVKVSMDLDQWVIEAGWGYRVTPEFDLLLLGRYYILDTGATSSSVAGSKTGEVEQDWGDIYIGARYTRPFLEKWFFSLRGDFGTGGSTIAYYGDLATGYRFTDRFSALLAWRVLGLDYNGSTFKYDMVQSGPGIGLAFKF